MGMGLRCNIISFQPHEIPMLITTCGNISCTPFMDMGSYYNMRLDVIFEKFTTLRIMRNCRRNGLFGQDI